MEQLGIDPTLLVAQIINFAIVIFVLTKFLYRPILDNLKKRRASIEKGFKQADEMEQQATRLQEREQEVLEKARKQAHKITADAKKSAEEIRNQAHLQAQEDVQQLKERAQQEIAAQRAKMEKDVEKHTVAVAQQMTATLLRQYLTAEQHHTLIAKQLKQISRQAKSRSAGQKTYEKSN